MLPARHRMRRSAEFTVTFRRGVRRSRPHVVVHFAQPNRSGEVHVGFVVSKAVGNAVTRNLVKRRMRAIMAAHVSGLPNGAHVVVRALPGADVVGYAELESELGGALISARSQVLRAHEVSS